METPETPMQNLKDHLLALSVKQLALGAFQDPAAVNPTPVVSQAANAGPMITFHRLKWLIFEPPEKVQVVSADENAQPYWAPLFQPQGQDHPLAAQPATNPPTSRMRAVLSDIHSHDWWHDAQAYEIRPRPVAVENCNGSPVTVGQFVREFFKYSCQVRDFIINHDDTRHLWYELEEGSGALQYFDGVEDISTNSEDQMSNPLYAISWLSTEVLDPAEEWKRRESWVRKLKQADLEANGDPATFESRVNSLF